MNIDDRIHAAMVALAQSYGIQTIIGLDPNHSDNLEYDNAMQQEELRDRVRDENALGVIEHGNSYVIQINHSLAEIDFLRNATKESRFLYALFGTGLEFETNGIKYGIRHSNDESTDDIQQRLSEFLAQSARA